MNSWLKLLLGADADRIPDDANIEFGFAGAPQSWGWLVLVAVLALVGYAVFWLYRREMEACPRWVKLTSAALRFAALLLLAVVFLSPYVTYLQKRTVEPHVVLLRDSSQSMNTADYYDDTTAATAVAEVLGTKVETVRQDRPTRTAVVNRVLAKEDGAWLTALAARGKLSVVDFAEKTEPVAAGENISPLVSEGRATDITQALDDALANLPLAAVVVLTDGQHNGARQPIEAARRALTRRVPLLIVGVGDPSRTRNLRVASVYVRPQVWPNEPFEVRGNIVADSVDGGQARVELLEQPLNAAGEAAGEGTIVDTTSITLPAGGGQVPVQFTRTLEKPGKLKYTIRVAKLDDERNEADNAKESDVLTVLDRERIRVLLVSATPSWEYRLLQPLLQRDKTISLAVWLQALDENRGQAGTEPIDRLPATEAQLFKYDVVLLLDPHPGEFTSQWVDLLRKFVDEHSGGVLYMAGPKYSAQFLTDARLGSGLRKILPVEFGDLNTIEVASLLSTNTRDWPLHVMTSNADHPLMKFYPSWQESLSRWENLPGIYWSFPALKQKPTSKLLLEHTDPTLRRVEGGRPLLVAGRYGSGRVVYLGFNGTWRWRRAGTDAEFFDRFWVQTVRFLAEGRSLKGQRRGYLQAERERYEIGEKVFVLAELNDASFQPLVLPAVEGTLVAGGAAPQPLTLKPAAESPGKYSVTFTARRAGTHTVKLPLPRTVGDESASEGNPTAPLEATFTVELPSAETTSTWLNKPLLSELAKATEEVGGRYFEISEIDQVPAAVPDRRETVPIPSKPITLWDRPWFGWLPPVPLLATLLLCVEWALRKGHKLL